VLALRVLTGWADELKLLKYFRSSLNSLVVLSMAISLQDIAQRAGEEAKNILGAAPGLARDGAAQYVKEGTPSGPIPNVGVALARQACRRYGDNPGAVPGGVAAAYEGVCRPYLDDIGYGQPPKVELPFRGGQCYGVQYRVTTAFTNPPIGSQTNEQLVSARVVGTFRGNRQPNQLTPVGIELQSSPGAAVTRLGIASLDDDNVGSFRIQSVVREGGGVDDCGNPAPVVSPPVPPVNPGPVREPFSPGPGIDIDIDVTIGPTGGITFNIGGPSITIDPFGGGDGGGGGGSDPGIDQPGTAPSSGLPPGDIGQPAEPVVTDPAGVASGCAPPNSVLVGIKVNILEPLPPVSVYDPLVYRGVCYAYMGTAGNLALNPEGVALRNGQMLFAPLDNLTCWEVRANVNFLLRVTPYYRALESQEV
jgi:hypothetical protein